MALKCVHKGCGKLYTDPEEECVYHPGPPEFHEGVKGWKCCKPRVLTFDEFLEIPPCTTGKHSTIDENAPDPTKKPAAEDEGPKLKPISVQQSGTTTPSKNNVGASSTVKDPLAAYAPPEKPSTPTIEEEDSDDPDTQIPETATCKRRACAKSAKDVKSKDEDCTFHPGVPIFHEGSKGWSCCKRRVLEFDEFMKIEGCKTRQGHCFVGKRNKAKNTKNQNSEEMFEEVRNDFYQGPNNLTVSFYLKKIDKARAKVDFLSDGSGIDLDLPTSDGKRFKKKIETWKEINPAQSEFKILGTKLEMILVKQETGLGWPVLEKGARDTGERIQVGKALRA